MGCLLLIRSMSLGQRSSDSAPLFSSDSEAEAPEEAGGRHAGDDDEEEEAASGVSGVRAKLIVCILCYINLLNYMDRFTVAGRSRLQPLISSRFSRNPDL